MSRHATWLGAAVVLAAAGAARAEVKDAADLLPAQTLACVELRQPERLSREVAALVKGSALDDMPAVMAKFREKLGDNDNFWLGSGATSLTLFLSPEMIGEAGRIQGAAWAVTGVNADGPEMVFVLLAGDSNLPTFVPRTILVESSHRVVGDAEGVNVYRYRGRVYEPRPNPCVPPPPPKFEESGPYIALLPDGFLLASSLDGAKDVIRRYKGKSSDPALTNVAAYKEAAKLRDRPGLFAFADLAALADRLDAAGKALGGAEKQWKALKAAVNPKAVRAAVASLTLQNGVAEIHCRLNVDPKEASPLVELLTGKGGGADLLQFVSADDALTLQLNLSEGEKRWEKALDLFDAVDRALGTEEESSFRKALRALEEQAKLRVGKDVLGRLGNAAVSLDFDPGVEQPVRPQLALQATDEAAAKELEETYLARLIGLAGGAAPSAAVKEEVDGQTLHAVAASEALAALGGKTLYVGRQGAFLVVGADKKRVAAALAAGEKKKGLLGDDKAAAAVKDLDSPLGVAVVSVGRLAAAELKAEELTTTDRFGPAPALPPGEKPKPPPPMKLSERAKKSLDEMRKAVEPLPPAVFGLGRTADGVRLDLKLTGLKDAAPRAIDVWVDAQLERMLERIKRDNGKDE
jgi:hypothetical protein